jgi:small conductance mechanosensitive channel
MTFLLQSDTTEAIKDLIVSDSVQKARLREVVDTVLNIDYNEAFNSLLSQGGWILFKIILAFAIYLVGKLITTWILRIMNLAFERRNVDASLRIFLRSMVQVVMMILVILAAVQTLGINTTSFVALFASAGLAVGMALSGTLQNFAGGVILLLLRPYRVGDFITAQGQSGKVREIGLFSTKITTPDNRIVYIPNSGISTSIIDNASQPDTRRVDWKIAISYGDNIDIAREKIIEMLNADSRVLSEPAAPMVVVSELANSAVILTVRAWTANSEYWNLTFDINEKIYKELPKHGINFPYPKLDVTIKQN